MHQLLFATVLLAATGTVQDGSLLILENSNKPVTTYTGSTITHVAVILNQGDAAWVYEATPAEVRRVRLSKYYQQLARVDTKRKTATRVWLLQPRVSYTAAQLDKMAAYMKSQLGRRYSVKGYVRGKQSDGVHCAEFASASLAKTGRFQFDERPYAISPAEFYHHVKPHHERATRIKLPKPRSDESWCTNAWRQWFDFREWCGWACYETWTFCR